jgi:DNA-binding response OmpR family regulator
VSDRRVATILAVDDEDSILRVWKRVLGVAGHAVLTAGGVVEAGRAAAASPLRVDLAIVDASLPDGSGLEAAEAIRRSHPLVRVLFVSGAGPEELGLDSGAAGGCAFLQKPFVSGALLDAVERLLGRP